MNRPSRDEVYLGIAQLLSKRSTCRRREVGCLLSDVNGKILSLGYNGVARGIEHCLNVPCPGAFAAPGDALDRCDAIHAEANALLRCPDLEAIDTCYTTSSPCIHCIKLLLNTSCRRIVFSKEYPHARAKRLWLYAGREWIFLEEYDLRLATREPKEMIDERT